MVLETELSATNRKNLSYGHLPGGVRLELVMVFTRHDHAGQLGMIESSERSVLALRTVKRWRESAFGHEGSDHIEKLGLEFGSVVATRLLVTLPELHVSRG
jgi:hypothetical protein